MKFIILFLFCFVSIIFSNELVETKYPIEDANLRVLKVLNKITNNSIKQVEKTGGFNYRYKSNFFSTFRFDIYVGKFSKKNEDSIIRIESTKNGEAKVFKNVLDLELNKSESEYKFEQKYNQKYHSITQTLNILSPMLSVGYNAYNSPFYSRNDTIIKSLTYLLYDLVILGIAVFYINNSNVADKSRNDDLQFWKRNGPSKSLIEGQQGGFVLAALAIPRIYRSYEAFNDTYSQNRMAELSYTYRF